jgi:hypothetical protein
MADRSHGANVNRYNQLTVLFLVFTSILLVCPRATFSAQAVWGIWKDTKEEVTYAFLENGKFWFRGDKRSNRDTIMLHGQKAEGSWQTGESICWRGSKDAQQQEGNLMVYVQSSHCCLTAERLGKNLALTMIWEGGYSDFIGVCKSRVLEPLAEKDK